MCQEEAGQCLGLELVVPLSERAKKCSLFFADLLDAKILEFNPCYARNLAGLLDQFSHVHPDISGNRQFVEHLRKSGQSPYHEEKRERDLILFDDNKAERKDLDMDGGLKLCPALIPKAD